MGRRGTAYDRREAQDLELAILLSRSSSSSTSPDTRKTVLFRKESRSSEEAKKTRTRLELDFDRYSLDQSNTGFPDTATGTSTGAKRSATLSTKEADAANMGDMEEMDYVADSEEEDRLPIERGSEGLGKRREQGIGGSEQSNDRLAKSAASTTTPNLRPIDLNIQDTHSLSSTDPFPSSARPMTTTTKKATGEAITSFPPKSVDTPVPQCLKPAEQPLTSISEFTSDTAHQAVRKVFSLLSSSTTTNPSPSLAVPGDIRNLDAGETSSSLRTTSSVPTRKKPKPAARGPGLYNLDGTRRTDSIASTPPRSGNSSKSDDAGKVSLEKDTKGEGEFATPDEVEESVIEVVPLKRKGKNKGPSKAEEDVNKSSPKRKRSSIDASSAFPSVDEDSPVANPDAATSVSKRRRTGSVSTAASRRKNPDTSVEEDVAKEVANVNARESEDDEDFDPLAGGEAGDKWRKVKQKKGKEPKKGKQKPTTKAKGRRAEEVKGRTDGKGWGLEDEEGDEPPSKIRTTTRQRTTSKPDRDCGDGEESDRPVIQVVIPPRKQNRRDKPKVPSDHSAVNSVQSPKISAAEELATFVAGGSDLDVQSTLGGPNRPSPSLAVPDVSPQTGKRKRISSKPRAKAKKRTRRVADSGSEDDDYEATKRKRKGKEVVESDEEDATLEDVMAVDPGKADRDDLNKEEVGGAQILETAQTVHKASKADGGRKSAADKSTPQKDVGDDEQVKDVSGAVEVVSTAARVSSDLSKDQPLTKPRAMGKEKPGPTYAPRAGKESPAREPSVVTPAPETPTVRGRSIAASTSSKSFKKNSIAGILQRQSVLAGSSPGFFGIGVVRPGLSRKVHIPSLLVHRGPPPPEKPPIPVPKTKKRKKRDPYSDGEDTEEVKKKEEDVEEAWDAAEEGTGGREESDVEANQDEADDD